MEEYLVGKTNTIYKGYTFHNKHQDSVESIDVYVTKPRKLSVTCEFGQLADQMIRDRIVSGITNNTIKKKLLQEADLLLKKMSLTSTGQLKKNAAQVKTMNSQEEVYAIKKASKPKTNKKPKDHKGA